MAIAMSKQWAEEAQLDPTIVEQWSMTDGGVTYALYDDFDQFQDVPCEKGNHDRQFCAELSTHCQWQAWMGSWGSCSLKIENLRWTYRHLQSRGQVKVLPVRALLMAAARVDDQLKATALQLIELYQAREISYGDMLASFYMAAPFALDLPDQQNDIDDVLKVWSTFARIMLPLEKKLDIADVFHTTAMEHYKPKSRVRKLAESMLWGIVHLGAAMLLVNQNAAVKVPANDQKQESAEENFYRTTGIDPNASKKEFKKQWRGWARSNHPDRGGDPALFAEFSGIFNNIMEGNT